MSRILVTGAGGAVGTALCARFAGTGHEVLGISHSDPAWDTDVEYRTVDLTEDPTLPEADHIVHLAANARVPPVVAEPSRAFENVSMLEPVLEHARNTGSHVVFASSREVFGPAVQPRSSDVSVEQSNPYGASKLAGESLCRAYDRCYDVSVTTLRLANVYGRYDTNPRVIPIFIALAAAGKRLDVFGAGTLLDFVYIEDVLDAFETAIERAPVLDGRTVAVGSGHGTPLVDLAGRIAAEFEDCPGYTVSEERDGETDTYVTDTAEMESLLGITPTALDEGLSQTISWYRDHPSVMADIRHHVLAEN